MDTVSQQLPGGGAPEDSPNGIQPAQFEPLNEPTQKPPRTISVGSVIIAGALLLSAAVVWFILTAKAVYIVTDPPTTQAELSAVFKLRLADRYLIRSGDYPLHLHAVGYHSADEWLVVNEEQNQEYSFALRRLPGHLKLDSGLVSGAQISLDGMAMGETPTTVRDIPHGEYQLRVSAPRFFDYEATVQIEGLDRQQDLAVELLPAWAEVEFDSVPAGAEIFVDDELVGETPQTVDILQGKRNVRVQLLGYKAWRDSLTVRAQEPMSYADIELEPADSVVLLVTVPPGASTTVDGDYKGLTPLELEIGPGKETTIRLFKRGYKVVTRKVTGQSGEQKRVDVSLSAEVSTVAFDVTPADAKVYVDAKLRGGGKQTIELSARPHHIEIRRDGYVSYETQITPRSGIAQQVSVTLKTLRQAKLDSTKSVITTSVGQTLKLNYPFAFTMGASRREAGRRANETLRKINLTRAFYLGIKEVSNEEFQAFDNGHSSGLVRGNSLDAPTQPVVNVTWEQAAAFCNWMSEAESLRPFYLEEGGKIVGFDKKAIGYRLPTEAEWAWAARANSRDSILKYPWGADSTPVKNNGNYADETASELFARYLRGYDDGYLVSAPVGRFPSNLKGIHDLGGNVAEWVNDFYHIAVQGPNQVDVNPMGPESGDYHVIRGSSWAHGWKTELRLSFRDYSAKPREDVGFRIARFLE